MTTPQPARVLVVDDSALMRKLLVDMLKTSPEIEIVGTGRDGAEAVELTAKWNPDVVTLDVEMPGMTGLEALPKLLADSNARVVMVSALTQEGASATLEALELGAFDFMPKPSHHQMAELKASRDVLVGKVLAAAQSRVRRLRRPSSPPKIRAVVESDTTPPRQASVVASAGCVAIGISTGGPQTLNQVFSELTQPIPPILVVQHMPARFTSVFADRLDRHSAVAIREAKEGDRIAPDQILIAPGGRHMTVIGRPGQARVTLSDGPPVSGHRPSVDVLFESAARVFGAATVGIIMTGMGRDGVDGCKKILADGGATYGQDEASSVVYGMNKAAHVEGAVLRQFALDELPDLLRR